MQVAILAVLVVFLFGYVGVKAAGQFSEKVQAIGRAIAKAEGYGPSGNLPTRARNPGDLKLGDIGLGVISGKTVFPDEQAGWAALYHQINLMVTDVSKFYGPLDTWREIAQTWVGDSDYVNWMATVTEELGVDPDSTLGAYIAS